MIIGDDLIAHTIYFSPEDFPGLYVGRAYTIDRESGEPIADERPFAVSSRYEVVRQAVPAGSDSLLPRFPDDHPSVVETWI